MCAFVCAWVLGGILACIRPYAWPGPCLRTPRSVFALSVLPCTSRASSLLPFGLAGALPGTDADVRTSNPLHAPAGHTRTSEEGAMAGGRSSHRASLSTQLSGAQGREREVQLHARLRMAEQEVERLRATEQEARELKLQLEGARV